MLNLTHCIGYNPNLLDPLIDKNGQNQAYPRDMSDEENSKEYNDKTIDTSDSIFENRKKCEEETMIHHMTLIRVSYVKWFTVVPILWLFTAWFILLFTYWYPSLKAKLYFKKVRKLKNATHLKIIGNRKQIEIIELDKGMNYIWIIKNITIL